MATANIVHCPPETKTFLTVETREGGAVRSVLANIDGTPVQDSGIKYAGDDPAHVAVYLDTITGKHVVKVNEIFAKQVREGGGKIMHGCGGVGGLFIAAPDFTLSGRHGEKVNDREKTDEPKAQHNEPAKIAKLVNPAKRNRR